MKERESVIKQGELELTQRDTCPICRGLGSYACVHCGGEDGGCGYCGDPPEHTCALCQGTGKRTPPEVLYAEDEGMRDVNLNGYRLQLWDTGKYYRNGPQIRIHYRLTTPEGEILFEGHDYGSSPLDAVDSDSTVRGIISFLTLRPEDTDADYFSNYTEAQWDFAHGSAEELSLWSLEPEHYPECKEDNIGMWECEDGCPMREYDPDLSIFPNWDADGDEEVR